MNRNTTITDLGEAMKSVLVSNVLVASSKFMVLVLHCLLLQKINGC